MSIKSRIRIIILAILVALIAIGITVFTMSKKQNNNKPYYKVDIVPELKDGLQDDMILSYFKEDIDMVAVSGSLVPLEIYFYDFDLNEDGYIDKIVILRSAIHSSAHGDSLCFLLSSYDGTYSIVDGPTMYILSGSKEGKDNEMYISQKRTNGCHDIYVIGDRIRALAYENGRYEPFVISLDWVPTGDAHYLERFVEN